MMVTFVWTAERPRNPGWYWVRRAGCEGEILYFHDLDFYGERYTGAEWAGPIPEPVKVTWRTE